MLQVDACPGGGTVYATDLKSVAERHVGSIPTPGTTENFNRNITKVTS